MSNCSIEWTFYLLTYLRVQDFFLGLKLLAMGTYWSILASRSLLNSQ